MSNMIRNLVILDKNGRDLLSSNFGECHSFGDNDDMISGFISAIYTFSKMLSADTVSEIEMGSLSFMLTPQGDLIFALSSDDRTDQSRRAVLQQIVNLFVSRYGSVLPDTEEELDTMPFRAFPEYLVKMGVLKSNCGKHDECADCENREKSLPLKELTRRIEQTI
jgi:hypothetical protein